MRTFFPKVFGLGVLFLGSALGCGDGMVPDPVGNGAPTWRVQHESDDGALLSVWGRAPDDVWVAGGQVDKGLILHGDGHEWNAVDVEADQLLWWIYGVGDTDVYAVGNAGLLLHYDGNTWNRVESGTTKNLYGVWGNAEDDVWIVGGNPNGPSGSAVVLRGSKGVFQEVLIPDDLSPQSLFKIYGHGTDDVLAVGSEGAVLRWDGVAWSREETPTQDSLFSLWGRSRSDLYAVGGFGLGTMLHYDGEAWSEVRDQTALDGLSGVFTGEDDPVIAVGNQGYVVELDRDGTTREPEVPGLRRSVSLHSVWGDGAGTTYAVGGDLMAYPAPMRGAIVVRQ